MLQLQENAIKKIKDSKNVNELNESKAEFLGKKSPISEIMSKMKELSVDMKKDVGQRVNAFKQKVEETVNARLNEIKEEEVNKKLVSEEIDVTLPGKEMLEGSMHVLSKTVEELEDIFIGMGYEIAEGPEIEEDLFNFEMMNLFYITPNNLLRTHTSPVQARVMLEKKGKPVKVVCPGKVYRRDNDDATHSHQFMQMEGLVVDKNITMSDLKGTLTEVFDKILGKGTKVRFRPSYFPFTEPSVEVDVTCFKCGGKGCPLCKGNGWIEILGAGMVHPNVLKMAGYDPEKYQGFAFGIGIERITMLKLGIDDIRNFYINDPRFTKQF
ncbi:MAG: phenylalanine--tRNA ligase subunit alpha [Coprobacillus sp. 28_7]|nr:MAG: phenylalanine--tRNA ligase subunit alpha [Coprobacillus sp. 28_7]